MPNSNLPTLTRNIPILLLFLLCFLPYSDTLTYDWHLDDQVNIHNNQSLHLKDLQPSSFIPTFFAHPTVPGKLYRPVSNFTFAINWFWGQDAVAGYHLTNIAIHFITALGIYLACLLLLQAPAIKPLKFINIHHISLLAAIFWALSPVHTQAVTYIVQRMAQLSALFTVFAIFFFLKARLSPSWPHRTYYIFSCISFFMLAISSKENGITLPLSLLLIEGIFFRELPLLSYARKYFLTCVLLIVSLTSCLIYLIHSNFFDYSYRVFSLSERLLTEPRILLLYLSQLFLPTVGKLSIAHDITVSTSLFSPWTTFPALIGCSLIIVACFAYSHKYPLIAFAGLFYFSNHLVESTIIPLELIFEHRNYQPSLFLFLPLASAIVYLLQKYQSGPRILQYSACLLLSGLIIYIGQSTYARNKVWESEESLWTDAQQKAPKDPRVMINLAKAYIEQGRLDEAFGLCNEAGNLPSTHQSNTSIALSFNCKGAIAYNRREYEQSLLYYEKALSLRKDYTEVSEKLISFYIERSMYPEALTVIENAQSQGNSPGLLLVKQFVLLMLDRPLESLETSRVAHDLYPGSTLIAAGQGKALSMLGLRAQADSVLRYAATDRHLRVILLQIENKLLAKQTKEADLLVQKLIQTFPLHMIFQEINSPLPSDHPLPYNKELLVQAVKKNLTYQGASPSI